MEEKQFTDNEQFLNELHQKINRKYQFHKFKDLDAVKRKWYAAKLVYEAAQEISSDRNCHVTEAKLSQSTKCAMDELLLSECAELIKASSSGSLPTLLGIHQPTDFVQSHMSANTSDDYKAQILAKIRKKLLNISQYYQPSTVGSGSNLLSAKASQLHHVVSGDKEKVAANLGSIAKLKRQRLLLLRQLQQAQSRNLHLVETLLDRYSLTTVPSDTTHTAQHLSAKTEALAAKIGLIEKELLADTYTPQLVKELSTIRSHLDANLMKVREDLKATEKEYQACLSAGTEFQRIAKEYSDIKKDIEARAWALNEFKAAKQHKTL